MGAVGDAWNELEAISPLLTRAIFVVVLFFAAAVCERIVVRALRRAYVRRVERAAAARDVDELGRAKRQKTLVTLLELLVRYGVYGAAIVTAIGIVTPSAAGKLFGASLVGILLGFGLQRLVGDVVAGALILFEGHFAVGDVLTVHQHGVTGMVEDFSLRTTTLRSLGGDRITVLNGSMASFTRYSYGQREYRCDVLVADRAGADAVAALCVREQARSPRSLWVRAPHVVAEQGTEGAELLLEVVAVVAPGQEHLVEHLAALLTSAAGESLAGEVVATNVHAPVFAAYRASSLVRD